MEINKRILLVDDEEDIKDVIALLLEDEFEIHTASNGLEALGVLAEIKPALIFLDFRMKKIDGLGLIEKIRSLEEHKDVKIVLVTGNGDQDTRRQTFTLNGNDFIEKPFIREEIVTKARTFVKLYNLEKIVKSLESVSGISGDLAELNYDEPA